MEENRPETGEAADSGRRDFLKKMGVGLALLPYVAPLVQSFTMTPAWANGVGTPPIGHDGHPVRGSHHGHP